MRTLKIVRVGHENAGVSALYGHITEAMVTEPEQLLQGLWEKAIGARFRPIRPSRSWARPWRRGVRARPAGRSR
ncbi:hypothetical protein GCM10009733_110880 [Nonomuraea maheshkhaliensis]|uniref:Uncharacterized protein n=1 Tax=Nonomuraea maheshkhaliensis TaxID=419590 RepID=A0ABN2I307_9ACTN